MRYDNKPVEPKSLEEEAWDINHPAKAIDDEPDPREDKKEYDGRFYSASRCRSRGGFWG